MSRDIREFTELLKPHYNNALKYTRALCASWSPDEAEDVLQQAFVQALENFGSLKDDTKFKSWFFKIITRAFYSAIRKHFWKKFLPLDENTDFPPMPEVFNSTDTNHDIEELYYALRKISSKERAAILLFEIGNFSIEEIRIIQGEKSSSAVKSRLSRARAKLKKLLLNQDKKKSFQIKEQADKESSSLGDLEYETIRLIAEIRPEK